jgi:pyrroline-5-carboxylate reductase
MFTLAAEFIIIMKNTKIAIIGCGNLGISIANGLISNPETNPENLFATRRNIDLLQPLAAKGVHIHNENSVVVPEADVLILALKPFNVVPVIHQIKHLIDVEKHIIISVATGITIAEITEALGKEAKVFRAMPNTAADVSESLTCIAGPPLVEANLVSNIFKAIGETIIIDEKLMEAATVLGACGIAYVMRFMRAMVQGGIEIGFDAHTATTIVNQTVKGAAELLITRKNHPEHEIDKVTTPKGCTIVGLNEMEHNGFSSSLIKGIAASFAKIEK